jgi:hypothetical protein
MRSDKDFTPACAQGELCMICRAPAQRKVEENIFDDDPMPIRHPYTAYLCLKHFNLVMNINDDAAPKPVEYYECHITMDVEPDMKERIRGWTEKTFRWKFSCIDGDPDLGAGIKCYATTQFNKKMSESLVRANMESVAVGLHAAGAHILRQKIEVVIFDERKDGRAT